MLDDSILMSGESKMVYLGTTLNATSPPQQTNAHDRRITGDWIGNRESNSERHCEISTHQNSPLSVDS